MVNDHAEDGADDEGDGWDHVDGHDNRGQFLLLNTTKNRSTKPRLIMSHVDGSGIGAVGASHPPGWPANDH